MIRASFTFPLTFACALGVALAVAVGGCPAGGTISPNSPDAAPAARGLGESCDPEAHDPCVTLTDVCSVSVCDPASRLCVRVAVDAGPTCSHGPPPPSCSSSPFGPNACDGGMNGGDASDAEAFEAGDGQAADGSLDAAVSDGGDSGAHDAESDVAIDAALDAATDANDAGD